MTSVSSGQNHDMCERRDIKKEVKGISERFVFKKTKSITNSRVSIYPNIVKSYTQGAGRWSHGWFDRGKRIHQRQKQSMRAANPDSHLYPDFFFAIDFRKREDR